MLPVIRSTRRIDDLKIYFSSLANFPNFEGIPKKGGSATMTFTRLMHSACWLALMMLCFAAVAAAQTETATISGLITDDTGAVVPGAEVKLQSVDRGSAISATTNNSGIYVFASVHPGQYQLTVHKPGFKQVDFLGLIVNVQDHIEQNFRLRVGSVAESVTVEASAATINTTDATVSTVVDRQFAENLPLNGRSFQTLIELTPGVVLTANNGFDTGQFSVNGQRAASNYWTVDGVSANIGIGVNPAGYAGNGLGGTLGSFGALGGTNSLVSVDAMQEFRVQTSSYAAEFGRTPGGQIAIVTRSGTSRFHGSAYDYFRNDALDANNWFNTSVVPALPKAQERQNDFGGTFSGPIFKDKTFFFFSYEGLRLRLPQSTFTDVPDDSSVAGGLSSRENAVVGVQPFLNAFPLPNGAEVLDSQGNATGAAQFNASYSNPASLDAYSLRIDHRLGDKLTIFGRYNHSPSSVSQRGGGGNSLNTIDSTKISTQTATIGATWAISPTLANDARFNYSRTNASDHLSLDSFGGAIPVTPPFPGSFTAANASFNFEIFSQRQVAIGVGQNGTNVQRQINVVDSVSLQKGSHALKFGVDFRRLSPLFNPSTYNQTAAFGDVPSAASGNLFFGLVRSNLHPTFLFRNLGMYAQDSWRVVPRLTVTYGLRWDVEFVPQSINGPRFNAVTGFDLNDLSQLALAPAGTVPYHTTYGNVAPRLGVAYQVIDRQNWQTVLRGGVGVFYDLATSEAGNQITTGAYPFGGQNFISGGTFPLSSHDAEPPLITPPTAANGLTLFAFDPHLQLPYTLQWNVAFEQALGGQQTISASYIGARGRRLIQTQNVLSPSPNFASAVLVTNTATSDYDALQIQFQRRLSHGLQALASYTWSHSIDTASAGSFQNAANLLVPGTQPNRSSSDFDVRNAFSVGVTYDISGPKSKGFGSAILKGWSTENFVVVHSATPVDVTDIGFSAFGTNLLNGSLADVRPDLVPGKPLYLYGSQCIQAPPLGLGQVCPGGKGFNPNAFTDPPFDPNTFIPLRQGDVPRNFLRGFGAAQWDFAIHRDFPIRESLKLQFRAELFNVLNHPNFGPPSGGFISPLFGGPGGFGVSTNLLAQFLTGGSVGNGALSSLYQLGGPRSIQLALKLSF